MLTLDQEGKLSGADDLPPAYQNLLKKTLSTQRIEKSSQLQGLTRPPSSLMGSDNQKDEFSVLAPAGDVLLIESTSFPLVGNGGCDRRTSSKFMTISSNWWHRALNLPSHHGPQRWRAERSIRGK